MPAHSMTIRKVLSATPGEVYAAWTDLSQFWRWILPPGSDPAMSSADVRVGGEFVIVMYHEGRNYENRGVYRVLDPASKVVFTWHSDATGQKESMVTIEILPYGDRSELVLTHELLPSAEVAAAYSGGWTAIVGVLAEFLDVGLLRPATFE